MVNSRGRNRNEEINILQFPAAKELTIYVKRHILYTNPISSQRSQEEGSWKVGIMSIDTI